MPTDAALEDLSASESPLAHQLLPKFIHTHTRKHHAAADSLATSRIAE